MNTFAPAFVAVAGAVYWGPVRLSPESCEGLLDIFDREGAAAPFNELYDAHLAVGGCPRVTSIREHLPNNARKAA